MKELVNRILSFFVLVGLVLCPPFSTKLACFLRASLAIALTLLFGLVVFGCHNPAAADYEVDCNNLFNHCPVSLDTIPGPDHGG